MRLRSFYRRHISEQSPNLFKRPSNKPVEKLDSHISIPMQACIHRARVDHVDNHLVAWESGNEFDYPENVQEFGNAVSVRSITEEVLVV